MDTNRTICEQNNTHAKLTATKHPWQRRIMYKWLWQKPEPNERLYTARDRDRTHAQRIDRHTWMHGAYEYA